MNLIDRDLLLEIAKWTDRPEILAIKGPRQSGKTTLLEMLKRYLLEHAVVTESQITTVTFEDRELRDRFLIDPRQFVRRYIVQGHRHVMMIDEAQYCPDLGQRLELVYDTFRDVKLIVTGSSSLELTSETARYLVGRMLSFELLPLSFGEFLQAKDQALSSIYKEWHERAVHFIFSGESFELPGVDTSLPELLRYLDEYLVFGGYPEVVKAEKDEEKRIVLKNIFNTYLEKDILAYLQISDTLKFRQLVTLLGAQLGGMASYEKLGASTGGYFKDIVHLIDVLTQTYIIRKVPPFHLNLVTELRKHPKFYFYDLGMRNYAINNFNPVDMRGDAWQLAENFVLNELATDELPAHFWRTTSKAEMDFVFSDSRAHRARGDQV